MLAESVNIEKSRIKRQQSESGLDISFTIIHRHTSSSLYPNAFDGVLASFVSLSLKLGLAWIRVILLVSIQPLISFYYQFFILILTTIIRLVIK